MDLPQKIYAVGVSLSQKYNSYKLEYEDGWIREDILINMDGRIRMDRTMLGRRMDGRMDGYIRKDGWLD